VTAGVPEVDSGRLGAALATPADRAVAAARAPARTKLRMVMIVSKRVRVEADAAVIGGAMQVAVAVTSAM
jgi:hypothetical protein